MDNITFEQFEKYCNQFSYTPQQGYRALEFTKKIVELCITIRVKEKNSNCYGIENPTQDTILEQKVLKGLNTYSDLTNINDTVLDILSKKEGEVNE